MIYYVFIIFNFYILFHAQVFLLFFISLCCILICACRRRLISLILYTWLCYTSYNVPLYLIALYLIYYNLILDCVISHILYYTVPLYLIVQVSYIIIVYLIGLYLLIKFVIDIYLFVKYFIVSALFSSFFFFRREEKERWNGTIKMGIVFGFFLTMCPLLSYGMS